MINLYITSENKIKINKRLVHKIIGQLKTELDFKISSLIINFVTSESILEVNKKFLTHNYTTDIITFNYTEDGEKNLDGEIFISITDVLNNSKRFRCSYQLEMLRVIIHGILHMLGYNDIEHKDRVKMKRLENKFVNNMNNIINNNNIILI